MDSTLSPFHTRSSTSWRSLPGNFDALNTRHIFASDNLFDIPTLALVTADDRPAWLVPYGRRVRNPNDAAQSGLHFFGSLDSETVWQRPDHTLTGIARYGWVIPPDFGFDRTMPQSEQLWCVYRSRWMGAWWQQHGLRVIPSIFWGNTASFAFAFCGIPTDSVIALDTTAYDQDDPKALHAFDAGFVALCDQLRPRHILCYGAIPQRWADAVPMTAYATEWPGVWAARRLIAGGC